MGDCDLGHIWEVYSGDDVSCIFCDAEGTVQVASEPEEEEDDE